MIINALLVLLMNPYGILLLTQTKQKTSQTSNLATADIQNSLLQSLIEKNAANQIAIQKYLRNISKKEKKIRKTASDSQLNQNNTPSKSQELSNQGPCYYSQQKMALLKQQAELKVLENPQTKWISNPVSKARQTKDYKRVRNNANNRMFLKPIQANPHPNFFEIASPSQSQPSACQKPVSKKQNLANQLRKLLLKQVYSMHQNIHKYNQGDNSDQKILVVGQQNYWVHKNLNIKRIGIIQSNKSRKLKTENADGATQQSLQLKRRLQQSDMKYRQSCKKQRLAEMKRIEEAQKLLPRVSASHLQRNKRCLQMFLKYTSNKKKNMKVLRCLKTQMEQVSQLKRCRIIKTVPLRKQS